MSGNLVFVQDLYLVSSLILEVVSALGSYCADPNKKKGCDKVLWHRGHHKATRVPAAFLCFIYFLTVLSWTHMRNGVTLSGKCCKSHARHICASPLLFTNVSLETEMPEAVRISCLIWVIVEKNKYLYPYCGGGVG